MSSLRGAIFGMTITYFLASIWSKLHQDAYAKSHAWWFLRMIYFTLRSVVINALDRPVDIQLFS